MLESNDPLYNQLVKNGSSSPSLLSRLFNGCRWFMIRLMNIILLDLPAFIIRLLSKNFEIRMNLSSILLGIGLLVFITVVIVRYKYLTGYSTDLHKNKETVKPTTNPSSSNLFVQKKRESKTKNYLDEFLLAIKVFGYLEKSVFHELTKNMSTQKLSADEILYLDESLGFVMVVEGTAQVYTKISHDCMPQSLEIDGVYDRDDFITLEDNQRYQLLNEVKSGAPLSSLISTLDLFEPHRHLSSNLDMIMTPASESETGQLAINVPPSLIEKHLENTCHDDVADEEEDEYPNIIVRPKCQGTEYDGMTIAVIPYSAFQRVQEKYPKSTSHIVTMVLTRLYKVTMNTVHNYLGLSGELLQSEIKLNEHVSNLPQHLVDGLLQKILSEKENDDHNNTSTTPKKDRPKLKPRSSHRHHLERSSSKYVLLDSRLKSSHPGDLLSSVPISRQTDIFSTEELKNNPSAVPSLKSSSISLHGSTLSDPGIESRNMRSAFSDDIEETEETSLRIAIVENVFKIMGINEERTQGMLLESTSQVNSGLSSANTSLLSIDKLHNSLHTLISNTSTPRGRFYRGFRPRYESTLMTTINVANTSIGSQSNSSSIRQQPQQQFRLPRLSAIDFSTIKDAFAKALEIKYIGPNSTLAVQDSFNTGLYYVIHGSLDVYSTPVQQLESSSQSGLRKVYTVNPGGIAGYLTSVVGFRSLVTIKTPANEGVIVAHINKSDYSKLMDKFYFLQLPVAIKLKSLLSKQILTIDYALEWCHIPAGNVLCSQGDLANGFHVVLSGRFRVVQSTKKKVSSGGDKDSGGGGGTGGGVGQKEQEELTILGEYGHGESIGEVEVLTASRRSNSLIAVRDSETARIPRSLFEMLTFQNPSIMVKVSRLVASKVLSQDSALNLSSNSISSSTSSYISNDYKTITILPTVAGLPVREFADKLVHALKTIGRNVIALDQASTLTHLGRHAFDEGLSRLKLLGYFAYLEEEYETVVYICDSPVKSNWTATCISQGDCILLLADADDDSVATSVGEYEQLLIKLKTTARTDLCLIHQEKFVMPGSTSIWLKNRLWVQGHHHIQMHIERRVTREEANRKSFISDLAEKISRNTNPSLRLKFEEAKNKAFSSVLKFQVKNRNKGMKYNQSHKNDFLRLARILSNEAVGLVLGGGGSRGISHVGVVTAIERHGIPVDLIGGTSIGSFVGGLYAKDYNIVSIYGRAKQFSKRIAAMWRLVLDFTYPVTSYITGYEFNRGIWKVLGFTEIEDFWIKYFCNSTNITNSTMEIHETGYLWRFIRASMSLAGLLPPIAYDGCMLLDGGYLDNLPVNEMKKKGAKYIIAVDVGSADDRTPMNYGDTLSGFWVLFNRWNPFSKHPNVPNMMDIQMRLAYVASVNALEEAKRTPGVIYLRPPIENYATLDFGRFDEIYQVGLGYADQLFTTWESTNSMPPIAGMDLRNKITDGEDRKILYRRNSI